ncbi:hypothetical protein [Endozoicomonas sp. G2_2]|uniref:hypothetical protein n=1 Tax=Endozoicomonas sp. G2_2 TaxID=2821092 RepID=UPI0032AF9AA9
MRHELGSVMENNHAGASLVLLAETGQPTTGDAIEIDIVGEDLAKLRELSESVQQTLRQTVGAVDVRDNLGALKPEIALYPDRGAIEFYDLTPQKLAAQVRYGMSTGEIGKFAVSGPRTISTSCSAWTGPADRAVVSVRPKPKHCPCCGRSRRTATPSRFRRCWCRAWTMRRYRSCTRRPAARSSSWPRKRTGR